MKQQLWIINSSLIGFFFIACILLKIFEGHPPVRRPQKIILPNIGKQGESLSPRAIENIYKNDIFGTQAQGLLQQQLGSPTQQASLATPIPELKAIQATIPPEPKKQEFIDPLNLSLKGIVMSSDESKNVAMIADETQKESLYHLGDKIKDAQIIKILKNRVVFLRANGQQEIFFLRKEDNPLSISLEERWKSIIKTINEKTFEIDPQLFIREIDSVGTFIDSLPLVGTTYSAGVATGIRVGTIEKENIGTFLGLKTFDVIVSIDDISTSNPKDRLSIYDKLCSTKIGDTITVVVDREDPQQGNQKVTISYKLANLAEQGVPTGLTPSTNKDAEGQGQTQPMQPGKMSNLQERTATQRQFMDRHPNPQRQETMMEIRKRLLDNLRTRMQNARVR